MTIAKLVRYVILALVLGCGVGVYFMLPHEEPEVRILGKWRDGNKVLEFRPDGSWYAQSPENPYPVWGTWSVLKKDKSILMGYANPPYPERKRIHPFEVKAYKLVIKDYTLKQTYREVPVREKAEGGGEEGAPPAEGGKEGGEKKKEEKPKKEEKKKEHKEEAPEPVKTELKPGKVEREDIQYVFERELSPGEIKPPKWQFWKHL